MKMRNLCAAAFLTITCFSVVTSFVQIFPSHALLEIWVGKPFLDAVHNIVSLLSTFERHAKTLERKQNQKLSFNVISYFSTSPYRFLSTFHHGDLFVFTHRSSGFVSHSLWDHWIGLHFGQATKIGIAQFQRALRKKKKFYFSVLQIKVLGRALD